MKILYITLENLSLHKGSVVHVREIIAGLRKLGHEVGLIACSWDRFEKADRFYNLHKSLGFRRQPHFISSILLFIYLIKVLPRYDILYARDYHTVLIALIPRIIFNKRLVFEINGIAHEEWKLKGDSILNLVISTLIRKAEGLAVRYSDRIVSVTPQIASYLVRQFYCPEDKVEVISNGVNTRIFHPIQDEASLLEWRRKFGIEREEKVVAFVGNLAPWQGVEYLVQLAPLLISTIENIKFMVIGNGILRKGLEAEVKRLGVSRYFLFTGMVHYKQIPLYINIADIGVAPFISKRNRKTGVSPLKVFEYMACGKPVVASRIEGMEFVEAEGAGLLVEPEDLISLETVLFELLKDPQKREGMGQRGLQIVQDRFSWDSAALRIEKLLEKLA
jgi:glycosyltransferase involved in cell wall biosynthesis